jgi:hypothetical protein
MMLGSVLEVSKIRGQNPNVIEKTAFSTNGVEKSGLPHVED